MLTHIQTQRSPVNTIHIASFPFVLAGSLCPTCGQAMFRSGCNRCHYCEDIDVPYFSSLQARQFSELPLCSSYEGINYHFPLAVLAGGQGNLPPFPPHGIGLLFAEDDDNGKEQPTELVEPTIPTNFDDLTDEQLDELLRHLLAQAAALYQSGTFIEDRVQPSQAEKSSFIFSQGSSSSGTNGSLSLFPVALQASLFSSNTQERDAQ